MKILTNIESSHYHYSSLQRGHIVFTSFISNDGKILFLDDHLHRLVRGADFLFPTYFWINQIEKIKKYVLEEFSKIRAILGENLYFRLTLFDDFLYLTIKKRDVTIEIDRLRILKAFKVKTPGLIPSYVKISNYLETDLELKRAKLKNFDEIVYFDNEEMLTEASTSNIFVVTKKGELITPPLSSLVLDGIIRKKLINKLKELGFKVFERPILKIELEEADEVWLTNSVKGLRFVQQFEEVIFPIEKENSLFAKTVKVFGDYGELI